MAKAGGQDLPCCRRPVTAAGLLSLAVSVSSSCHPHQQGLPDTMLYVLHPPHFLFSLGPGMQ